MTLDRSEIEALLASRELIDELAAIEHRRWAHWQAYLHAQCEPQADGSLRIPSELVERWNRQIATDYVDLSEKEKQSDREQVEGYLPTISRALLEGR